MESSHLTLIELEGQTQSQQYSNALYLVRALYIGSMLLLNINRKPYMGESKCTVTFDLE